MEQKEVVRYHSQMQVMRLRLPGNNFFPGSDLINLPKAHKNEMDEALAFLLQQGRPKDFVRKEASFTHQTKPGFFFFVVPRLRGTELSYTGIIAERVGEKSEVKSLSKW